MDKVIGTVSLTPMAKLVFTIRPWKGRNYAHVRKFIITARYEGPSKSGLAMAGDSLMEVIKALERLQAELPGMQEWEYTLISKTKEKQISIRTIPPDDLKSLQSIDVREYLDTPGYKGPTKKGIRFSWDKLHEVLTLFKAQAQQMKELERERPTLFPEIQPEWVEKAEEPGIPIDIKGDPILGRILPDGLKNFPEDFLGCIENEGVEVHIPPEPIEVVLLSDGKYVVRSSFSFCHAVRNVVEGNFIYYASLRGHQKVLVPKEMFAIFKAVKVYETYLRELKHSLIQAYERKSGHRPIAEHQAKEVFRKLGLPWTYES
jgi:hypothetical protein